MATSMTKYERVKADTLKRALKESNVREDQTEDYLKVTMKVLKYN